MTNLNVSYDPNITSIAVNANLMVEGKLNICLMQLAAAVDTIEDDLERPAAVAAIRHLLSGGDDHAAAALGEMVPGRQAVLIVLPEFALGSGDWGPVDQLIRGCHRPIVFVAGFGATPGQVLLDWREGTVPEGETERHFAWDQAADGIGAVRRINGGWCWVHLPGERTICIAYRKCFAEQTVEAVRLPDIQFGDTVTHLRFNDIDLFPLVCADMLQLAARHPDSAQARIKLALNNLSDGARPALVVGSLLQHGYNVNWELAIDSFLNQVMADRPALVALCNIAHDKPVADEEADRWRSISGVYGRWDNLTKGQTNLPCGRQLNARGIAGAVVRRSVPIVASGVADWGPYGPVDGKFVWHANMLCLVEEAGLRAPISLPPEPHGCELVRFLRRFPAEENWSDRVAEGSKLIEGHIESGERPTARVILNTLLGGVRPSQVDPDKLHSAFILPAAIEGLHSIAAIATIPDVHWQADQAQFGQLHLSEKCRNILVWRDPGRTGSQILSELGAWRNETIPHPDLVVFAAPKLGDVEEGRVEGRRRDDISVAPSSSLDLGAVGSLAGSNGDVTLPKIRRKVVVLRLSRVASLYAEYDAALGDSLEIDSLLNQIESYLSGD